MDDKRRQPSSDKTDAVDDVAKAAAPPRLEDPSDLQKIVSSLPVDHSGTTVYVKGWRRDLSDKHPIIIVHDLGEHTELYREAALALVHAGYSVYIFDLRGHGRSGRRLGHAPSFDVLVKDLLQVAAWVRHKERGKTPVILGQGIGALVTIEFTKAHGNFCEAAILSAPSLELIHEVSLFARIVIKILAELSPTFRIPAKLSPRFAKDLRFEQLEQTDKASRAARGGRSDEEPARATYFPRLTAVFAQQLLSAINRTVASFIEYHGSVLILCPDKDAVCGYTSLKKSAALHDEHNLKIVDLPDVGHAVFTEDTASCAKALAVIMPWLEEVLRGPPKDEAKLPDVAKPARRPAPLDSQKPGATKT